MQPISSQQDYKNALIRIQILLDKGSQGVSCEEIHEITCLRRIASDYEKQHSDPTLRLDKILDSL